MTRREIYKVSRDRILVLTTADDIGNVLAEFQGRAIVAIVSAGSLSCDARCFDWVIGLLLDSGCSYFVCFGNGSEMLHDRIDDAVSERCVNSGGSVVTTWHDDEPEDEVASFFLSAAGANEKTLLVGLVDPSELGLRSALINEALNSVL